MLVNRRIQRREDFLAADLRPPVEAPPRPRLLELLDEDLDPERLEPEDFAPERAEDFFEEERPVDAARPVVRLEEPRPEDGPAVRPVDFADELRDEELRELEPDFFEEADFELDFLPAVDLLPVDLECDFELGLEVERLEDLPVREERDELLPRARAFSE